MKKLSITGTVIILLLTISCQSPRVNPNADANGVVLDTTMINLLCPPEKDVFTGGDGAISIVIDKDKSVWFWGDSFVGEVIDNKRDPSNSPLVAGNVFVELDGKKARSIYGGTPEKPHAVVESDSVDGYKAVFWPHHGFVKNNILHTMMSQILFVGGDGVFGFRHNTVYYMRLSLPDYKLIDKYELPEAAKETTYGYGFIEIDGHYYFYGNNQGGLHAGRAKLIDDKLEDMEFFTGIDWSSDASESKPLEGIDVYLCSQFSVFPHKDKYIFLTQEGFLSKDIYTFISDSPTGPWKNKKLIYSDPVSARDTTLFTYNAMGHPQYDKDGMLLVSYCINTFNFGDLWKDASIYRPRFFRVPYEFILKEE